jgi:putative SOS response-associated peptidase YedK
VRHQLQQQGLPVDEAPADDVARQTYNFPPGAYGLVYRADVPDNGVRNEDQTEGAEAPRANETVGEPPPSEEAPKNSQSYGKEYRYHLKAMKWGLVPFWTKRSPDYGSMLRTINCRDDSLIENRGMWNTMKQRKRCIVIAQGFYEWLKKGPGGKERIPHFVKRKDGQLMCFAGLWDCVKYEDTEEKLYTYAVITTDSNKQLSFLHDRMPVILDAGSEAMKIWLDPERNKWTKELQSLLKPYAGELECYPVSKEVGKVGNNSPDFIVPIDDKDNKKNIANFFNNTKKNQTSPKKETVNENDIINIEQEKAEDDGKTKNNDGTENNAPLPVPVPADRSEEFPASQKRKLSGDEDDKPVKASKIAPPPEKWQTPTTKAGRKIRSATSNEAAALKKSPAKKAPNGSQKITNFFGK